MKRLVLSLLTLFITASLLAQEGISFEDCFPVFNDWEKDYSEKTDDMENMGMILVKANYLYKDGMKKMLVGIQLGPDVSETKPGNVPSVNMNGIIMKVKRIQGFQSLYTYTGPSKEGRIIVYMPANKSQKYNGMLTFTMNNMSKKEVDRLINKFNVKKIQKRMKDLK